MTTSGFRVTKRETTSTVAILDYGGAQRAAVLGLADLLETAAVIHQQNRGRRSLRVEHYDATSLSESGPRPSAVVLPPRLGHEPPGPVSPMIGAWLLKCHRDGSTLCSVCVGAFVLAQLGLLDGRPATTHWAFADPLATRHPAVNVDTDRLLIDDGDIVTAGGVMAWIDLGLHLVSRFLSASTMLATARMFLVDPGGREQRFYATFSPETMHGDDAILRVQRLLKRKFVEGVDVDTMAATARLGRRTFLRRFEHATGLKTSAYLQHLRVAKARELLERGAHSQEEVAWAVGYTDPGAFRRVFIKILGLSPAEYRRRFPR